MHETWKPVVGYEKAYEVSSHGRVRSVDRTVNYSNGKVFHYLSKVIRPAKTKDGYLRLSLSMNNRSKSHLVHRLVASAFIPNMENKPEVNHKDGNPENNSIENLEWVTASENIKHAFDALSKKPAFLGKLGTDHHLSKPITIDGVTYGSYREAARILKISRDKAKRLAGLPRSGRAASQLIEEGLCHA